MLLSGCTTSRLWKESHAFRHEIKAVEEYSDEIQSSFVYKNAQLNEKTSSGKIEKTDLPLSGIGL